MLIVVKTSLNITIEIMTSLKILIETIRSKEHKKYNRNKNKVIKNERK